MFQLEKRVNSITVNDAEREEINELLIRAQELTGMVHTSIKDSYKQMLIELISRCSQTESTVQSDAPKNEEAESTVQSDESTVNSEEFENALFERTKALSDECTVLSQKKEELETECTVKSQRIQELEAALQNAFLEQEVVEIEVEKPFTPGPNDVYLQLTEARAETLRLINRQRRLIAISRGKEYSLNAEDISQLALQMLFADSTLYNWSGFGFDTGYTDAPKRLLADLKRLGINAQ